VVLTEILDLSRGILVVAHWPRIRAFPTGTLIVSHGTLGKGLRYKYKNKSEIFTPFSNQIKVPYSQNLNSKISFLFLKFLMLVEKAVSN
jgi:hypothetical protein